MSPDMFHKLSAWLTLSLRTVKSKSLCHTKILENRLSALPAFFFESMGYMQKKNTLFRKTCVYLLPSGDLHLAFILSVDQSPQRIFLVNTLYVIYIILNGRTEICRNFCIVFFIVLEAVEILIPQRSLRY